MEDKIFFRYNYLQNSKVIDMFPTQFGWQKIGGRKNKNVSRDCYILHVILGGKGVFYCKKDKYELGKNQAFLIRPGQVVSYYTGDAEPWEYVWMGVKGADADAYFGEESGLEEKNVFDVTDAEKLKRILKPLFLPNPAIKKNDLFTAAMMFKFLDEFSKQIKRVGYENDSGDDIVSMVIRYIGKHYKENLSVESICREFHLSRTCLFKKFKKETGKSPQEYIIDFRMTIARQMIENTDVHFNIIAIGVGYPDYEHFCKLFIKRYGLSPKKHRESKR